MAIIDNKILTPMTYVQSLERKPTPSQTRTYQQLQSKFDQGSEDLRLKLNALIDSLLSVATDSGAKNIGVETIPGVTGNDVQTVLLSILNLARNSQAGNLLPGIITDAMLSDDNLAIKTRLLSVITDNTRLTTSKTLTGAINELFTNVDNGKNSVYSAIVGMGSTPASKDFTSLVNGINAIIKGQGVAVENQVAQGVTFSNSDGVLRTGTATIESLGGKKFKNGSGTTDSGANAIVTGLGFTPSIIIIYLGTEVEYCIVGKGNASMTTNNQTGIVSRIFSVSAGGFNAFTNTAFIATPFTYLAYE